MVTAYPANQNATYTAIVCPLCGRHDLKIYSDDEDENFVSSALGSSRQDVSHGKILRCRTCEFGFRQLRPPEEELARLYRELAPEVYEKESRGRVKTANRHLRVVQQHISGGRILDIGCASGAFLRCALEANWEVVGVEPAEVLCGKAKQLIGDRGQILCTTLQRANLPPASFDAVTLWDVLEHVLDPVRFLVQCASLLKLGGFLFANVPDLDSLPARFLKERWPLLLAEHLNYFNRNSLKKCGGMAGLQWIAFGRRPAAFSLEYVLYRLAQHNVLGASFGHKIIAATPLGGICIPVFLGETYIAWRLPEAQVSGANKIHRGELLES